MLPVRTILHPTDFSCHSDYAYRVARMVARDCKARVILLHVAEFPVDVAVYANTGMDVPFALTTDNEEYGNWARGELRRQSEPQGDAAGRHEGPRAALDDRADGTGLRIETRLVEGRAATEILRTASESTCDLIVMGTHGRSGLGRILLGSVAEEVLRKAPCPVLTLRTPAAQAVAPTGDRETAAASAAS